MPTSLQASRDFMARGIAAVRAGVHGVARGSGLEGPEIKVDPFGPGNVSTAAGLAKVATSILAARRTRANYEVAQGDAELARQKARAEIARIRAEEQFYLGQGRQTSQPRPTEGLPPAKVTLPHAIGAIPADTPVDPRTVGPELTRLGQEAVAGRARARAASVKNYAQAQAGLRNINESAKRDTAMHAAVEVSKYDPYFAAFESPSPDLAKHARDLISKVAGVDLKGYDEALPSEKIAMVKAARAQIEAKMTARVGRNIDRYYAPERARLEGVTRAEALNLQGQPAEAAAPATPAEPTSHFEYDAEGNLVPAGP